MKNLLVCCPLCACDSRVILDENAIWITLIICITIFATVFSCVLFYNNYKKSKRIIDLEEEKKQFEEMLSQKEKLTPEEKEKKEEKQKKEEKDKEEKKTKDFLDYCYNMAKSLEEGNEKQREDCWKILLHVHAKSIPDELKQEYNVGKNDVENAGKTE